MKRHLATPASIAKLHAYRQSVHADRSKAPQNSGLTKDETRKAMGSLSRSGYKIPTKLIPKAPN
jgi:hypothetical protein